MIAPGEVQAPGTEKLVALDRLAEQLDPILCEAIDRRVRCGYVATWHNRATCHTSGGSLVCDDHKAKLLEVLRDHHLHCLVCGGCIELVWTKL